jgi:iron complex outermembrane receptor protein
MCKFFPSVGAKSSFQAERFLAALFAVCMVQPAMAMAGEQEANDLTGLSIEELLSVEVYSASKFSQKTAEAPANVSIITAADIANHGFRTLADLMASVRGFYVSNDRNYQYLGARGFNRPGDYNSRILLMVDGNRLNDPVYNQASIGNEFPLDMDLVERVEVVRGPGSSNYGSNAFFAVINVITKKRRDMDGAGISAVAASHGGSQGRLSYGMRSESGVDLLLSVTGAKTTGQDLYFAEFDDPATNNGIATGLDGERYRKLYGKLAYEGYTLSVMQASRIKQVPTAAYGTVFNDPNSETTDAQSFADLAYYGKLDERWELDWRAFYGSYTFEGDYPFGPPVVVNRDETEARWGGAEARFTGRFERHKLILGAEYQNNYRQDQRNFDVAPHTLYLDDRRSSSSTGVYVQDEIALADGVLLNAGVRHDRYSTVGGSTNPRLGLIWLPQQGASYKFLYGTAFRAPNAYELYYNDGNATSKANPDLKPEKITSYEFVAEQVLQANYRLTVAAYHNDTHDLINEVTDTADGLLVFRNIGHVRTQGAEIEVERAWGNDTRVRASYAWQHTRDLSGGVELENSPRHLAKFSYSRRLPGGAHYGGVEVQYTGPRKTLTGAVTGGFSVVNVTLLSRALVHGMALSASVYNLLDKRYADPARPEHDPIDAIVQDGRSFRIKLDYSF